MFLKKMSLILLGLTWSSFFYAAQDELVEVEPRYTTESAELLIKLENQIKGTLLAIAENESKRGKDMSNFHFEFELASHNTTNLGLELDIENVTKGYKVLSVNKNSPAEKLAIKSGDLILAINDVPINQSTRNQTLELLQELSPGQELKLALTSNDNYKEVSTRLDTEYVPRVKMEIGTRGLTNNIELKDSLEEIQTVEAGACGVISVALLPPIVKHFYSVGIVKIDGNNISRLRDNFQLTPGKHTILLYENIYDPFLGKAFSQSVSGGIGIHTRAIDDNYQTSDFYSDFESFPKLSFRRFGGRIRGKVIELVIKANTTYHLGAKYNPSKKHRLRTQEYWEPVIWRTSEISCSL